MCSGRSTSVLGEGDVLEVGLRFWLVARREVSGRLYVRCECLRPRDVSAESATVMCAGLMLGRFSLITRQVCGMEVRGDEQKW